MPLKLEDIIPAPATFKLRLTDKTYRLRPVSLDDESWMNSTFGDKLGDILGKIEMRGVCRIVYRLMEDEDRESLSSRKVTLMNEAGEKVSETKGGVELLYCLISGHAEKMAVFEALLQTIGISRPMMKQLTEDEKKNKPMPPKPLKSRQTGRKSSTG